MFVNKPENMVNIMYKQVRYNNIANCVCKQTITEKW
jgi:hypothetical protein